jgi:hypothetical protein
MPSKEVLVRLFLNHCNFDMVSISSTKLLNHHQKPDPRTNFGQEQLQIPIFGPLGPYFSILERLEAWTPVGYRG